MKYVSERVINLAQYENMVREARNLIYILNNALAHGDVEASSHIAKQVDLKLHELEAYEFEIEQRIVTVSNPDEYQ